MRPRPLTQPWGSLIAVHPEAIRQPACPDREMPIQFFLETTEMDRVDFLRQRSQAMHKNCVTVSSACRALGERSPRPQG